MKLVSSLAAFVVAALVVPYAVRAAQSEDVGAKFAELAKKQDRAGTAELWKANPDATLSTIDEYLEGSLALIEDAAKKGSKVDEAKIQEMHQTAIFGARAADLAFDTTIFADYASSYAGFTPAEQKSFRRGQAAHHESSAALKSKKFDVALARAMECRDLAQPLGDWWGTAMGLSAMGSAYEGLGKKEEALAAHSEAALIYGTLRLGGNAYQDTAAVARLCVELGRKPRAEVSIERAIEAAARYQDEKGAKALEELKAKLAAAK